MTVSDDQLRTILAGLTGGDRGAVKEPARNAGPVPPQPWCRADCGAALDDSLVDREDNSGLHPGCDEPVDTAVDSAPVAVPFRTTAPAAYETVQLPEPAEPLSLAAVLAEPVAVPDGTEPLPTLNVLRAILAENEANSARSRQKKIGPSEIGVACQRALAYKLAGTEERPDNRLPWAPIQGTAVHAYIAEALEKHNAQIGRERWIVEQRVWPDDEISGSGDAFDCDTGTVIDWKLVGDSSIYKYRKQMRPEYRIQAHLYGLGHERAGRDVKWVRIVCLSRGWDYGKSWEWTEPYDPEIAINALARMYGTEDLLRSLNVVDNPHLWGVVPATFGPDCRYCRFFRPNTPADASGCPGDPDPWALSR